MLYKTDIRSCSPAISTHCRPIDIYNPLVAQDALLQPESRECYRFPLEPG
jgi:hypothetical protein